MLFDKERLKWREEYAVGVPLIDEEHQRLFAMLENLHTLLAGDCDEAALRTFAFDLIDYTTNHLAEEETEMRRVSFPGYLYHKAEHDRFRQKSREFVEAIEHPQGPVKSVCFEMIATLADWFAHHFTRMDREAIPRLKRS